MQRTNNVWPWLALITIVVMGAYLWFPDKGTATSTKEVNQAELQHVNDSMLIARYRNMYTQSSDSIMMLKVEKGQVEIELNRANEQLKNSSTNYKEKKRLKDTGSAMLICDSIVYTYIPEQLRAVDSLSIIDNNLGSLQETSYYNIFSLGDSIALRLDTSGRQLVEAKREGQKPKEEKKASKRRELRAGILGAAVGVLITIIANAF